MKMNKRIINKNLILLVSFITPHWQIIYLGASDRRHFYEYFEQKVFFFQYDTSIELRSFPMFLLIHMSPHAEAL